MSATDLALQTLLPDDSAYPTALKTCGTFKTAPTLTAIGSLSLLQTPGVALFCSNRCPGDLILKTYDWVQTLRDAGILVIGGFHTSIERNCFEILLRGTQPVIYCPARSLHRLRLSPAQKQAVHENRLLILSPFRACYGRATAALAAKRNEFIGAIAHTVVIGCAAPDSKTLALAEHLIRAGKSVLTCDSFSTLELPGGLIDKLSGVGG